MSDSEGNERQEQPSGPQTEREGRAAERLAAGDKPSAEGILREVLSHNPQSRFALDRLGVLCARSGRFHEAARLLRRLMDLDPGNHSALNSLGNVYAELGRHEQARIAYQDAIDIKPDYAAAHQNLARLYKRSGDYEAFVQTLKASYRLRAKQERAEAPAFLRRLFRRRKDSAE